MNFEGISIEKFYLWGFFLLAVGALANTITFGYNLFSGVLNFPSVFVSALTSLLFSWLLAGFFYYLKRSIEPSISDEDFLTKYGEEKN